LQSLATSQKPNNFKARVPLYLPFPFSWSASTYIISSFMFYLLREKIKLLRMKTLPEVRVWKFGGGAVAIDLQFLN
jgi:hypothetical protein